MPVSRKSAEKTVEPYWRSECGRAVVYVGDCREVMAQMEPDQFHAVVTDPPYGLEFMGNVWDAPWKNEGKTDLRHNVEYVRDSHLYQEWFLSRAEAMLRAARPGAHLLSFGGTRMWHRMACAVEDAGWEVRDTIMWVYGSGFPKSHDVSKAIDKTLGSEREVVGHRSGSPNTGLCGGDGYSGYAKEGDSFTVHGGPVTAPAIQWDGWGTSLKPAHEPVILARKPFRGSVAERVMENGCGGLNIDGCRVGTEEMKTGRWPANFILSYPDDKYELRDDVTPEQLRQLADWMHENS